MGLSEEQMSLLGAGEGFPVDSWPSSALFRVREALGLSIHEGQKHKRGPLAGCKKRPWRQGGVRKWQANSTASGKEGGWGLRDALMSFKCSQ